MGDHQHHERTEHGPSGSHREHRRRRRHKKDKPGSKLIIVGVGLLIVVVAAVIFFAVRPRSAESKAKETSARPTGDGHRYVAFGSRTIIIMNPTETDWGYTTVTVNDRFEAHCPEIPKGTQFEFFFRNLRGPEGAFEENAEKVQAVKIQPDGQKTVVWTRPIE